MGKRRLVSYTDRDQLVSYVNVLAVVGLGGG